MSQLKSTMLAIFIVTVGAREVRADCSSGGVWAWPTVKDGRGVPTIPVESALLLVEGSGIQAEPVFALQGAALAADDERVPLKVVHRARGEFDVAQVVLTPTRTLRPVEYTLELPNNLMSHKPLRFKGGTMSAMRSALGIESPGPTWSAAPIVTRTRVAHFGCGPAILVTVTVPVSNPSETLFLVELDDGVVREQPRQYIVQAYDGAINIGHYMCSGPFKPTTGQHYTARIVALDGAGNRAPAPHTVSFVGP